jgi:predicted phosphodiesterase
MLYAFLSDIHGYYQKLEIVLANAHDEGVDHIISLGDVGGDDCLTLLREAGAEAVFGNYEVSGWQRLAPENRTWVREWPRLLAGDCFVAVHATPWRPEGLETVEDFGLWLRRTGHRWRTLFPYLAEDSTSLWHALAELKDADKAVLFHGHTHQQNIWQWHPAGHLRQVRRSELRLRAGYRYLVGVGSVGLPEDGAWATYALYDEVAGTIRLMRLDPPFALISLDGRP